MKQWSVSPQTVRRAFATFVPSKYVQFAKKIGWYDTYELHEPVGRKSIDKILSTSLILKPVGFDGVYDSASGENIFKGIYAVNFDIESLLRLSSISTLKDFIADGRVVAEINHHADWQMKRLMEEYFDPIPAL